MRGLEGQVAVVTGASSGHGRATSLRLAEEGAAVVCADWNGPGATALTVMCCGPSSRASTLVS